MNRSGNGKQQTKALQKQTPKQIEKQRAHEERERLLDECAIAICKITGTRRTQAADRLIDQLCGSLISPRPKDDGARLISAVFSLAELAPKNMTESMLAAQMIAVNDLAFVSLRCATREGQTLDGMDKHSYRATRLMRLFSEQAETMQRLKGQAGQQKVTVEHVHVHDGGQAIVGAVSVPKGEGGGGK